MGKANQNNFRKFLLILIKEYMHIEENLNAWPNYGKTTWWYKFYEKACNITIVENLLNNFKSQPSKSERSFPFAASGIEQSAWRRQVLLSISKAEHITAAWNDLHCKDRPQRMQIRGTAFSSAVPLNPVAATTTYASSLLVLAIEYSWLSSHVIAPLAPHKYITHPRPRSSTIKHQSESCQVDCFSA